MRRRGRSASAWCCRASASSRTTCTCWCKRGRCPWSSCTRTPEREKDPGPARGCNLQPGAAFGNTRAPRDPTNARPSALSARGTASALARARSRGPPSENTDMKRLPFRAIALLSIGSMALVHCSSDPGPVAPDPTTATVTHAGTLILRSGQKLPIQYEIIDGKPRWLGDIDLKPAGGGEMHLDGFTLDAGGPSTGTFASGQLWKNNMVYYRFDSTIADPTTILAGMMDWMSKTQVSFLYDNDKTASDYILFRSDTSGCHSGEGHRTGENDIYLQQGACFADQAVHEIGHTMGLLHEQSRPDRDNYITIQWSNICQGAASGGGCASFNQASNFQIVNTGIDVGSFDFSSIMLYPAITGDPHFAVDTSK